MKKIININLSSRLIPIEDSAYDLLKNYIESLKRYFAKEEGRDEIISDIESRIAEIFQDKLRKGAHCITDEDVNTVITAMGRPEQFDEDSAQSQQTYSDQSGAHYADFLKQRKRLYRDPDDKILGGVCSGLGAYFDVDPIVFRLIFALLLFGAGTGILLYIILWIATPEAKSAAEKLEMRGERVDLQNISNAVKEEMDNIKGKMENMGKDIKNFSQGRGREIGNDVGSFFRHLLQGLANVLVFLTKGFFYFLAVVILIMLIVAMIAIAVSSAALFPLKNLIFDGFWQNFLFWPAVILLIGIPIVALIIFIVRKLIGARYTNRYVGFTLSFLWIIGLACAVITVISVVRDFSMSYHQTTSYSITQPPKRKLIIMPPSENGMFSPGMDYNPQYPWFYGDLEFIDDTPHLKRISIRMEKSPDDSFRVFITKISDGRSVEQAAALSDDISLIIYQKDSILYLGPDISLPPMVKFRNQHVIVTIDVPVNKNIQVNSGNYFDVYSDDWSNDQNDDYDNAEQYQMTPSGLQNKEEKTQPDTLNKQMPSAPDSPGQKTSLPYRYKSNVSVTPIDNSRDISSHSTGVDELSYLFYALLNLTKQ